MCRPKTAKIIAKMQFCKRKICKSIIENTSSASHEQIFRLATRYLQTSMHVCSFPTTPAVFCGEEALGLCRFLRAEFSGKIRTKRQNTRIFQQNPSYPSSISEHYKINSPKCSSYLPNVSEFLYILYGHLTWFAFTGTRPFDTICMYNQAGKTCRRF